MNGYSLYTVKSGDSFYSIASAFGTTVNSIIFANPSVDYNNLQIGETIVVPYGNIVPTNQNYTTDNLIMNINSLRIVYPFLMTGNIGTTPLRSNNSIY